MPAPIPTQHKPAAQPAPKSKKIVEEWTKKSVPESAPEVKANVAVPSIAGSYPAHLIRPEPVRLTPPRPGDEERINLARPVPVSTPGEVKKKAIANSCSQFSDERIQANVERIQREARRNAPQTRFAAIEQEVGGEKSLQDRSTLSPDFGPAAQRAR